MRIEILGILIGTGLFAGGFAIHDMDMELLPRGHVNWHGEVLQPTRIAYDKDKWEHTGYLMGLAGAAILTLSIDRMRNEDKPVKEAMAKFRKTVGILAGAGAIIGGQILHERGEDDIFLVVYGPAPDNRPIQWINARNNPREHLGFFLGAVGASTFVYSLK